MSYKGSQSGYTKYAPSPTKNNSTTSRSSEHSNPPTGSQSKTSTAPPTKYNIPCKYYKSGVCKLGDQCRFLHQGKVDSPVRKYNTKQPTSDQTSNNTNNYSNGNYTTAHSTHAHTNDVNVEPIATSTPVNSRVGRKPYLHIVVLYASDIRVLKYAKEMHTLFLDNGVDVFLHSEVNVKNGVPPERVNKETEIKTENLAEIITTSRADYLIVLGDRNMKNRTCQAKNKGKLTEMDVGDMLKALWAEWSQAQSLNDEDFDVDSADDESVQELLDKYTGVKHIKDRFNKLLDNMSELKDTKQWRAVVGSDDDSNDSESNDEDSDNSDDGYRSKRERRVAALTTDESYRSIASKMTQIQKGLIRIHEQLVDAEQLITNLPILESEIDQSEPGDMVSFDFQPSTTPNSIAEHVKEFLLGDIRSMIESIEEQGNQLTAFGAPLWAGYIEGYNQKLKDAEEQSSPASPIEIQLKPGQWQCSFCTYVNEEDQHNCKMCAKKKQSGKPEEVWSESSEWEVSGTAAKKLRKQQQRQQQEKEPEPEVKYVPKDTSEKRRSEPRPAPVAAAAEPKAAAPKQALTPGTTPVKAVPQPVPSLPTSLAPKQAANGTASTSPGRISPQLTPNGTTIQPVVPNQQLNLTPQTVPSLSLLAQQINKPAQPVVSATPFLSNNDFFSSSSLANLLQLNSALQQQNNNSLLVNGGQTSPQPYQPDYEENFPPLGGAPQANPGAKKTAAPVANTNTPNSVNITSQLPLSSLLQNTTPLNTSGNAISTPEIGFLSFNNTNNTSANNQANQGGSWNPLQSSLYPQSGTLGQYPPLSQPFAQLPVSNNLMGSAQPKMSAGVLPQPKMQQQPDFNLISGLWSKEPTPTSNMTSFNTNTMNSNPNSNQSSLLSQPFDPWKSPFQSPSPQPITPPPQQRSNLLNNLTQPGLPLNVQNNFFASNPLFNPNPPLSQPNLLANPYTPLNNPIIANTPSNTNNTINNNTSLNNSTEVHQSNSTTNSTSFPNNLTISLANLQNKRSFNPYSQQNMLIGEFSEEFIREMQKAREVTDKKYANLPKPNRPCCYCGEESQLECNLCANVGLATYFCSAQHQSLVWKQHLLFHKTAFNLQ